MAIINQVFNKTIPVKVEDAALSNKFLSGVIYKDDTWLDSAQRDCFVFLVDPTHSNPARVKFEAIARAVVLSGHYFYLAYGYGQSGSVDLPYGLYSGTGKSTYHRMAYYGGVVVASHLSHLGVELRNTLNEVQPFTLISQGLMGLAALSVVNDVIDYTDLFTRRMVNNTVLLDPVLGNPEEDGFDFLSVWQAIYSGNKCLMLFRSPIESLEGTGIRKQARSIRLNFVHDKLMVVPVGADNTPVNWTETQSNLWITHALNHRTSDGYTLPNGEADPFKSGL